MAVVYLRAALQEGKLFTQLGSFSLRAGTSRLFRMKEQQVVKGSRSTQAHPICTSNQTSTKQDANLSVSLHLGQLIP